MGRPRATSSTAHCRVCRQNRPLSDFTTDSADCNSCKAERERTRAAKAKRLTPAQVSVVELVCLGKTNEEIGTILARSPLTVKNHVRHIIHKLDANNRTYAAVLYTVKKIKDEI